MLEKTNTPGLARDPKTGMLVNTNMGEYDQIKARMKAKKEEQELRRRIEVLEAQVAELMRAR